MAYPEVEIGKITDPINGKVFKSSDWSTTGIPIIRIQNLKNNKATFNFIKNPVEQKYIVEKGDLLFAWSGTPGTSFGAFLWNGPKGALNQHIFKLPFDESKFDKLYLFYVLNYKVQNFIDQAQGGVGLAHISKGKFVSTTVPVPDLPQQKIIVRKIESFFAEIESGVKELENAKAKLELYRKSLILAATRGKLKKLSRNEKLGNDSVKNELSNFLEHRKIFKRVFNVGQNKKELKFKEPVLADLSEWNDETPENWELVSISQFAECLDSIRVPIKSDKRKKSKGLYPYFGANGEVGKIDEFMFDESIVMVTEDETFYGRTKPIAFPYAGKCWVNNHAHVLKSYSDVATEFLCFSLMYYEVLPWLSGTTGRAKLTQESLLKLPILVPPKGEMSEIVKLLKNNESMVLDLISRLEFQIIQASKLKQSILKKAFDGELI